MMIDQGGVRADGAKSNPLPCNLRGATVGAAGGQAWFAPGDCELTFALARGMRGYFAGRVRLNGAIRKVWANRDVVL